MMVPPVISLTFGSGKVDAAIATDKVRVAGKTAHMKQSLLLMVSNALDFAGPFEGILGLGLPKPNYTASASETFVAMTSLGNSTQKKGKHNLDVDEPSGFLEQAHVSRFSICFNDGGNGVLRLEHAPMPHEFAAVGKAHWALELGGISVGKASRHLSLCSNRLEGQETACAAIPDSGTTMMMGPKEHIVALLAELCTAWPRCQNQVKENDTEIQRALAFNEVLLNCNEWANETHGLDHELPPFHFHFVSATGQRVNLTMKGAGYVLETLEEDVKYVTKHLYGISVKLPVPTGHKKRVCSPAFGMTDYNTSLNGPVWILGLPIFYEYHVGYNLEKKSISFDKEPCGTCTHSSSSKKEGWWTKVENSEPALLGKSAVHDLGRGAARQPRRLHNPPRLPSFDFSGPL